MSREYINVHGLRGDQEDRIREILDEGIENVSRAQFIRDALDVYFTVIDSMEEARRKEAERPAQEPEEPERVEVPEVTEGRMTFDFLGDFYRAEMNGTHISACRPDIFPAMADLLVRLRREYEKQLALDPDSVMCEGAEHRKKSAERLCKEVVRIRATKICNMAFLGALGSKSDLDVLTEEEREFHDGVLALSRRHLTKLDRYRALMQEGPAETPAEDDGEDAPEPVAEAPGYDPARPTDEDVAKVREALTGLWSTVAWLSMRTGLKTYVVRRACQRLATSGEAVYKETAHGIQTYRKVSMQVQQTLPEPKAPRRKRGCAKVVLSVLDGERWTPLEAVVKRVSEADPRFGEKDVRKGLEYVVESGRAERWPPVVKGMCPSPKLYKFRLAKKEGGA